MPFLRSSRVLLLLWLVLGVSLWNAIFDLYVSRGAREFLQLRAEADLGLVPAPSMADVMRRTRNDGLWAASFWALVVMGAGVVTLYLRRQGTGRESAPPIQT
jgi:hypothetical protein